MKSEIDRAQKVLEALRGIRFRCSGRHQGAMPAHQVGKMVYPLELSMQQHVDWLREQERKKEEPPPRPAPKKKNTPEAASSGGSAPW